MPDTICAAIRDRIQASLVAEHGGEPVGGDQRERARADAHENMRAIAGALIPPGTAVRSRSESTETKLGQKQFRLDEAGRTKNSM